LILYLDTSALIKLYVSEAQSDAVERLREQASIVATVMVSYAEAAATFARRIREQPTMANDLSAARREFFADWPLYLRFPVSQPLLDEAARLADGFALRGYDSVQLAAARLVGQDHDIVFASFDTRLANAAELLGMKLPFPKP
jgi:predicted nucleic acid-binding protein